MLIFSLKESRQEIIKKSLEENKDKIISRSGLKHLNIDEVSKRRC
ncbi:MAG: hypothetical protein AMDU5_GPLC00003G0212 [Thermoplasmatales archaeon Gpl]|nr:MAG: hypothetical protein AMDU5_GPLC00003G0212 [Thermoplasmatales archaeon Gpl]